jgi:hypothetical protein
MEGGYSQLFWLPSIDVDICKLMLQTFVVKRYVQGVPLVLLESDAGPSPKLSSYCTCLQNHKW